MVATEAAAARATRPTVVSITRLGRAMIAGSLRSALFTISAVRVGWGTPPRSTSPMR
jgi:hypothetical protein